jgi:glucokinase
MMRERYVMAVDLGGTRVRLALSNEDGSLIGRVQEKVDKSSEEAIVKQIISVTRSLCRESEIDLADLEGVGIASAGPLSLKEGALINPTNLPFEYVPLTEPISEELGVPAYLVNDCTAAVLGERAFGAGKGLDNIVYITIGTGIGGGAIVDGCLLLGKDGNAVEIGHLTIDFEGRLKCGCGKRGHWEAYCSGRNIPNFVRMRLEETDETIVEKSLIFAKAKGDLSKLTSETLFNAAKEGDKLSLRLVEEIGVLNAIGFANVINAYDPSLITVGGTVTLKNTKLILSPISRHVENYVLNRVPKIIATPLGEDVGILGAVATVLKFRSQSAESR